MPRVAVLVRLVAAVMMLALLTLKSAHAQALAADPIPDWAFPINPPGWQPAKDDGTLRRLPDSTLTRTLTQLRDLFDTPDWYPDDHPPIPEIVAQGRRPSAFACGVCHRANGPGGPESANLTGLSVPYMMRQMDEFRSGARVSLPGRVPFDLMVKLSRAVTDDEARIAATYFASLPYRSMVDVVETDTVPRTTVSGWFLVPLPGGGTEPLGSRIIELPADLNRYVDRDSRVRFTAYVPVGSIARGHDLATTGGQGRTVPCATCHGEKLTGTAIAPPLAGRSPSYVVRQLHDFRAGTRAGAASAQMLPTVEHLGQEDMIAVAAYVASLQP